MIYVSSSCVKAATIREAVELLVEAGFRNIELSGGTQRYETLEQDLLRLKEAHSLNFLCHNYFPPPLADFVLNIASLDDGVSEPSVEHIMSAMELSRQIGAKKFAFHAGFLINIPVNEIGEVIQKQELFDRQKAKARFSHNYQRIIEASKEVDIYVENNVISQPNLESYDGNNPLFITDSTGLGEFADLSLTPLLDVAHLKVSSNTLGLNFENELVTFANQTDYVHVSDNDGKIDNNQSLKTGSELFEQLKIVNWQDKTVTLEVYTGLDNLRESYRTMEELMNG